MSYPANMTVGQIRELVENPGQPIRQPAVCLMTVDTADRLIYNQGTSTTGLATGGFSEANAGNTNSVYINKQQTLINGYITRIALTDFNMNWNIPNVNEYNNSFTVNLYPGTPGADLTITVSVGANDYYTMTELATALTTALNTAVAATPLAASYTFLVQANKEYRFFTIINTVGTAGSKARFAIVPRFGNRTERLSSQVDDLCQMMGFGNLRFTIDAEAFTSSYASMIYTPYIDVVSKQLTKKQNINDNCTSQISGQNLLARIYLNPDGIVPNQSSAASGTTADAQEAFILGCRPFTINREFQVPKQIYWDTKEFINVIDLELQDYLGRTLFMDTSAYRTSAQNTYDCGNEANNWNLTLQITET
jgi:hypothetical protein